MVCVRKTVHTPRVVLVFVLVFCAILFCIAVAELGLSIDLLVRLRSAQGVLSDAGKVAAAFMCSTAATTMVTMPIVSYRHYKAASKISGKLSAQPSQEVVAMTAKYTVLLRSVEGLIQWGVLVALWATASALMIKAEVDLKNKSDRCHEAFGEGCGNVITERVLGWIAFSLSLPIWMHLISWRTGANQFWDLDPKAAVIQQPYRENVELGGERPAQAADLSRASSLTFTDSRPAPNAKAN